MRALWIIGLCVLPVASWAQESDKDFLTRFLEENLSSAGRTVTISGFSGALSSTATMAQMTIADDQGIWLTVRDVKLDWSQSALLSGQVVIDEFSAGDILLDRLPVSTDGPSVEAGSFSLPDLPVSIDIKTIAARHFFLGPSVLGQSVEGQLSAALQLSGGQGMAALDLTRTDAGPSGQFHLSAAFQRATGQLDLSLIANEGAGGVAVSLLGVPGAPSAELLIQGSGPVAEFGADVSLKTDGVTRLAGKVQLIKGEGGSGFTADLAGDPTPVFLPQYATFFGPDVAVHAQGHRPLEGGFDLTDVRLTAQALQLAGTLRLDPDFAPSLFSLAGTIGLPEGNVVLPLTTTRETRLRSGTLSLNYDRSAGEEWQGVTELSGLDHAAFTAETLRLTGHGTIAKTKDQARFSGIFDFAGKGLRILDKGLADVLGTELTGQAQAAWHSGEAVSIRDLALHGQGFDLTTTGQLGDLAKGLALTGTARGSLADMSRLSTLVGRPLQGAASFDLSGSGTLLTGQADVTGSLSVQHLSSGISLLDNAMADGGTIDLSLVRDTDGIHVRELALASGSMTTTVSGEITSAGVDLTGKLGLGDLSALGPSFGGALAGNLALNGPLETVSAVFDGTGTDLAMGQDQIDRLLHGTSQIKVDLQMQDGTALIRQADLVLENGALQAKGQVSSTASAIDAQVQIADLGVLLPHLRGKLDGVLRYSGQPAAGQVTAQATSNNPSLGQPELDLLLRGANELSATLNLGTSGTKVQVLTLSNRQMLLRATGQLGGGASALDVEHRILDLALLYPQFPGALVSKGTVRQQADGYGLDLSTKGPGQIDAVIKGRLTPDLGQADLTIKGTASAGLANKLAAPRSLSGPVRFDLRLQGPLTLASVRGSVVLTGGRLADPAQNFGLTDVAATAELAAGRARISASASVTSGGAVTASGAVGLTTPYPADLAFAVTGVTLRDPDLYSTRLDGSMTLKGPILGAAMVSGTLDLGRTELRIPSTGFSVDGGLPGLQHVNEPAASRETRARVDQVQGGQTASAGGSGYGLNLRVNAPNQVFIRGRGLDAELGGALTLRGRTDAVVPSGAFNLIRGRLDILGRRLTLTEALLQMQGALVPYLRIVASVESGGILASVLIEGDANDPKVSFTSSPDLPQEEVLAHLLFDRGLDTLTAFQAIQLAGAVATLAGKGGEGVIGNLRKKAGVDNLDVTTDAAGSTAVTIGKYISDKAYTEATVGQGGKSSITLNLDVAPHITLKGRLDSDGQTGIGIFLQRDY